MQLYLVSRNFSLSSVLHPVCSSFSNERENTSEMAVSNEGRKAVRGACARLRQFWAGQFTGTGLLLLVPATRLARRSSACISQHHGETASSERRPHSAIFDNFMYVAAGVGFIESGLSDSSDGCGTTPFGDLAQSVTFQHLEGPNFPFWHVTWPA